MHEPKWCLFYDVHTMPAVPDVGAGFDADAYAERIARCGIDYVVFHARCNLGMAYYNTELGIRHPSLNYDLFGDLVEALRKRDIALTAYVNVGLSHEESLRHRDWLVLMPDGRTYQPDRMNHFMRMMCYNSGYGDHVVAMCEEIVRNYPVAGLFLDCMHQHPCVGRECMQEMKELGIDWTDDFQLREFAQLSRVRIAKRIADAALGVRPDLLLYFNGVSYESQDKIGTYLEYECLPTGGWGYEVLPLYGRFMRTLGKPLLNMTGRFHRSWGDFGGIRTEPSIEYDVIHSLALGMRVTIGDHFHPRGDINEAVFDLIERVYGRAQRLEPWLDGARAEAEIALVAPWPGFSYVHGEEFARSQAALKGAARMLCELKQQFDVVSLDRSWDGYRLLILPDLVTLDEQTAAKVQAHLDRGGAVLSSGWSGADPDRRRFVLEAWGLGLEGEDPADPAYLLAGDELAEELPNMPLVLYDRGTAVAALEGTHVLAETGASYFNRHWDGEHHHVYLPPDGPTGRAAVTIHGPVAHLSHPFFTTYYNHAPVPLRQIVSHLLDELLPHPMVRCEGLPSFGRAMVTSQPGRRMVYLLSYVPERRGAAVDMIEEPIELREVVVSLRIDDRRPVRAYLAPNREELPLEQVEGYVQTVVPWVNGYAVVVFEEE